METAEMKIEQVWETTAQTAKRLRRRLKDEFPGQKFSVRSSNYAGGSSIHVSWTDGPTEQALRQVKCEFEGATFDGMTDMKEYKGATLLANEDGTYTEFRVGADYVLTQRAISQAWREEIAAEISAVTGEACDLTSWGDVIDGEQARRNGDGWDRMFCALVVGGRYADDEEPRIVLAGECSKTSGRDIFYRATQKARA